MSSTQSQSESRVARARVIDYDVIYARAYAVSDRMRAHVTHDADTICTVVACDVCNARTQAFFASKRDAS